MQLKTILRMTAVLAIAVMSLSCKKKNTEDTRAYLEGTPEISEFNVYQYASDSYTEGPVTQKVHVDKCSHPKKKKLSMSYTFNGKTDTLCLNNYDPDKGVDFTIVMPEDVGDYTLSVIVWPEDKNDYYSSSSTKTITIVDPFFSVPEIIDLESEVYEDLRETRFYPYDTYPYVTIDGTDWMTLNMHYDGGDGSLGHSYNSEVMDFIFGRFYSWEEANSVCPEGWELPGDEDFVQLVRALDTKEGATYSKFADFPHASGLFMIKASFNGTELWPYHPEINVPKEPKFKALPAGYMNNVEPIEELKYYGFKELAMFWTSDMNPDNASQAMFRFLNLDSHICMSAAADISSMAMSVRCVRKN